MKKYIIGLDEGTTSACAVLWDVKKQCVVSQVNKDIKCYFPEPDWTEQDAEEIYEAQLSALNELLEKNNIKYEEVHAIGITNQRESVVFWDKATGKPVCPVISWLDRRTESLCNQFRNYQQTVKDKTGLNISSYFSATKLKWAFDSIESLRKRAENGEILCGTIDVYLVWKLTGGKKYVTDMSNASRTMLFNINTLEWDKELFDLFTIPKMILPEIVDTAGFIGEAELAGGNIPICAVIGDQQSALLGQGCFSKGSAKVTYGTGVFLLANIGEVPTISNNKLLSSVAWSINSTVHYALEGSIYNAGSAVQWIRDNLGLIKSSKESEELAMSISDSMGVYFVPAFNGLGTPYWDNKATGTICGITRITRKEHIVRATLESMAYGVRDIIESFAKDSDIISSIKADGGACENNFMMQFQADILNMEIIRPSNLESTAKGAIFAAGLGCGIFKNLNEIEKQGERVFKPNMDENTRKKLYAGWKEAVGKARYQRTGMQF